MEFPTSPRQQGIFISKRMENTFQHTPGPWAISPKKTDKFTILADDPNMPGLPWHIAVVCSNVTRSLHTDTDDAPANANLIAAAPELLEALQNLVEIGKRDLSNPKHDGYFEAAKAAIDKATTLNA